jgi:hypothetical protein
MRDLHLTHLRAVLIIDDEDVQSVLAMLHRLSGDNKASHLQPRRRERLLERIAHSRAVVGGGPFDAASGFTVFSTGFSSAFGAASGLLSFSTAGGFSPGFGPFGGSAGAGCPVIRGFSLVSGATLPVSGAISAAFPAALASVERHRRL